MALVQDVPAGKVAGGCACGVDGQDRVGSGAMVSVAGPDVTGQPPSEFCAVRAVSVGTGLEGRAVWIPGEVGADVVTRGRTPSRIVETSRCGTGLR